MPRPQSISDQQILTAARGVFLEHGIRATTAEVARRAGVAEGTLFKRFKNKDELFAACLSPEAVDDLPWIRTLAAGAQHHDARAVLLKAGKQTIEFFRQLLPLMMMKWSNAGRPGLPPHLRVKNPPPLRAIEAVASFFAGQIRLGNLRRHDPRILARVFVSSMQNYAFTELLLREADPAGHDMPAAAYVRSVVALLWAGAAPEPRRRGSKRK